MRGLIFDPFAGISGDMILGALIDVGLGAEWLSDFVASLGLGEVGVQVSRARRRGIACTRVEFGLPHEHAHRHLSDVLEIVDATAASRSVKDRAGLVFQRLAAAEAAIHGVPIESVHFHEVGALDAILDVMCAVAGVEELRIERCYSRPIALGSGWIEIEHGRYPLPAPATVRLLAGLPVRETGFDGECTTPTGAAILGTLTEGRAPPPEYVVRHSGYGAGARDPEDRPNCLRVIVGETDAAAEQLFVVQADVDDMPAEYVPPAVEALFEAGALDVIVLAAGMKKGRPGVRIEALVRDPQRDQVVSALFQSTSTIGARFWPVSRIALPRSEEVVEWQGQRIRRKRVRLPDGTQRSKPEYDDVLRVARTLGLAPQQVRTALEGEDLPIVGPQS